MSQSINISDNDIKILERADELIEELDLKYQEGVSLIILNTPKDIAFKPLIDILDKINDFLNDNEVLNSNVGFIAIEKLNISFNLLKLKIMYNIYNGGYSVYEWGCWNNKINY